MPPEYEVDGIRLDTELNYPLTVQTNVIHAFNVTNLIHKIKSLCKIIRKDLFSFFKKDQRKYIPLFGKNIIRSGLSPILYESSQMLSNRLQRHQVFKRAVSL